MRVFIESISSSSQKHADLLTNHSEFVMTYQKFYKLKCALGFAALSLCLHGGLYFLLANSDEEIDIVFESTSTPTSFKAVFVSMQDFSLSKKTTATAPSIEPKIIKTKSANQQVITPILPFEKVESTERVEPTVETASINEVPANKPEPNKDQELAKETTVAPPQKTVAQPAPIEELVISELSESNTGKDRDRLSKHQSTSPQSEPKALQCPFPRYPRIALMKALEGIVLLEVTIQQNGAPEEVSVKKSSGYRFFDQEATRTVQNQWMFASISEPQQTFDVTIRFELE